MPRLSLLFVALLGCDDFVEADWVDPCPPAFALDANGECVFDEASVQQIMRTFDQGDMALINPEPFEQITSPEVLRNVWVNSLPTDAGGDTVGLYRLVDPETHDELPAEFPVGTVIVHERVDGIEGSTVQVKRELGFENEGGGRWWFGKYFPDGTPDEDPCNPCHYCHTLEQHPGTEGLWGVPREAL